MSKKYQILKNITNDAPFGDVNYMTVSFLTPQKIKKTELFDILLIKIHNGYGNSEQAKDDGSKIKESNDNHDVYICEMGRLYGWDDKTKVDEFDYGNKKQNELEKSRKENEDQAKLLNDHMGKQLNIKINNTHEKINAIRQRMQNKLYQRNEITKQEYDMLTNDKSLNRTTVKNKIDTLNSLASEIDDTYKNDYLDEGIEQSLKYGCMTIFFPSHIKNLNHTCFKIRGVFQTIDELQTRINNLQSLYPHDKIYTFEVGKWCVISELGETSPDNILKYANYAMKCYLDNLENEKGEFEKRKKESVDTTSTINDVKKKKSRKNKKSAPIHTNVNPDTNHVLTDQKIIQENIASKNDDDTQEILDIINYINTPISSH